MKFIGFLLLLVSLMFSWCVDGGLKTRTSCSKQLGITVHHPKPPEKGREPVVCVSNKTCCSRQLEDSLRKRVVQEIRRGMTTKYDEVQVSVMIVHDELKGYFLQMINQSFHKTVFWLSKSHKNLTSSTKPLLKELFKDMASFVADSKEDLHHSVDQFFQGSFPLLYPMLDPSEETLSDLYNTCLMKHVASIRPFGDKPEELVKSLTETLSPVQIFLRGLLVGAKIITSAKEFDFASGCDVSMLKMKYCSLCQGINDIKPCHRYCMDLMESCMASEMQLRNDWSEYIKSLVLLADALSKSALPDFTSEMYKYLLNAASSVLTSKETLLPKVLKECGKPSYKKTPSSGQRPTNQEPTLPTHTMAILPMKMEEVKPKVDFFADLFLDLPKGICEDDQMAASRSELDTCWNGDAKARFVALKNPGAFQASVGDIEKLKSLVTKIREAAELVKTSVLILQGTEDEDGSGSGVENEISGSGECRGDDEDCGSASASGGGNNIDDSDNSDNDIILDSQPSSQPTEENDVSGVEIASEKPKGNPDANESGLSLSSRCTVWQSIIAASLVIILLLK